jgi:hypothetical protein
MSDNDMKTIEKSLKRKKKHVIPIKDLLSSSSTLLNLATSGRTAGCYAKGHYYWFVGDSQSGKTWLALAALAEASINPEFDNYRLIHDNCEHGALMSIRKFFGPRVAKRLEPPNGDRNNPEHSETLEQFYDNIDDAAKDGRPFIYILDSMDSIDAKEDQESFDENKKKRRKGKEVSRSYGTAKAKLNSTNLRRVTSALRKSKSILIIISQVRQNIGFGAQFAPDTVAGGKALMFYCTLKISTKVLMKIKRVVKGKKRAIGIISKVRVEKNRIQGKDRTIGVPIYYTAGVDDIGSCIDYLIEEKHWKGTAERVEAPEFDYKGSKDGLIHKIENEELESELKAVVSECWQGIEEACEVKRKSRYH